METRTCGKGDSFEKLKVILEKDPRWYICIYQWCWVIKQIFRNIAGGPYFHLFTHLGVLLHVNSILLQQPELAPVAWQRCTIYTAGVHLLIWFHSERMSLHTPRHRVQALKWTKRDITFKQGLSSKFLCLRRCTQYSNNSNKAKVTKRLFLSLWRGKSWPSISWYRSFSFPSTRNPDWLHNKSPNPSRWMPL